MVLVALLFISNIGYFNNNITFGVSSELPTKYPIIYVYPERSTADVGETFTISVIIYNLTNAKISDPYNPLQKISLGNLYGFDIQFSWDPTVIQYVNYSNPDTARRGYAHPNVAAPVEKYPNPIPPSPYAGVLHGFGVAGKEVLEIKNVVNETGNIPYAARPDVRAWFAYATFYPAAAFNGNGTLFTMTFKVLKSGVSSLKIEDCILADKDGDPIGKTILNRWLNPPRNDKFRTPGAPIADFTYWPSMGVVNKTMYFNATVTGNITSIATYMWDFGDGTKLNTTTPKAKHNYTTPHYMRTVALKVVDADDIESETITHPLQVVTSRDLKATSITFSSYVIEPNEVFNVTVRVDNIGSAPFSFSENYTLMLFYNTSTVDWGDVTKTAWTLVGIKQTVVSSDFYKLVKFTLNSSSLPVLEVNYYFLLNVTGIPKGYEENTTNNIKISETLITIPEIPSTIVLVLFILSSSVIFALTKKRTKKYMH